MSKKFDFNIKRLSDGVEKIINENKNMKRLDGWFYVQELKMKRLIELRKNGEDKKYSKIMLQAILLDYVLENLSIKIREHSVFVGDQDSSFSRTYALINPFFKVELFKGYCDPLAPYSDIYPCDEIGLSAERIEKVKKFWEKEEYVKKVIDIYSLYQKDMDEVIYFVEPVTGHIIPDFRPALKYGLKGLINEIEKKIRGEQDKEKIEFYKASKLTLYSTIKLAKRYSELAKKLSENAGDAKRKDELIYLSEILLRVPENPATSLYEALQFFRILWMVMSIEQSPNPYAFSVGNLDRIFQPYWELSKDWISYEVAVELMRQFLLLYNVGDKNWAISQNIMVCGKDENDRDLTCEMSYIILDAFYKSNYPQPALSVKVHKNTPMELYYKISDFFFTPGHSTPSLFNDDVVFKVLRNKGIEEEDLKDYSTAGCQENLIMGKENQNTTNSWLNLGKVLELTINDGYSLITKKKLLDLHDEQKNEINYDKIKKRFYQNVEYFVKRMVEAANKLTDALGLVPVPFVSTFMGGIESGYDMRDTKHRGTKYVGSGCLIHGLTVVGDSFTAIKYLENKEPELIKELKQALQNNFEGYERLRDILQNFPKFGNDEDEADKEVIEIADKISDLISEQKNSFGGRFYPDWSTPSTHLLYGYWVGATPDGRLARTMLNYGVDPLVGNAKRGLPVRIKSLNKLPFLKFTGGYASHIGLSYKSLKNLDRKEQTKLFLESILNPLFGFNSNDGKGGYYVYFNVDNAEHLRKLLAEPEKYCPSGIYILRIHGTFVNFLDLSPAIQEDIIARLEV